METKEHIYEVAIYDKDTIVFKAYITGQPDMEIEVLDFYYQKYSDVAPNISNYKVRDISLEFEDLEFDINNIAAISASLEAYDYSQRFN